MAVAVAVAVAVSGGGSVAVAGLTKRFFDHIQKDLLINVWGYVDIPLDGPQGEDPVNAFIATLKPFSTSIVRNSIRLKFDI